MVELTVILVLLLVIILLLAGNQRKRSKEYKQIRKGHNVRKKVNKMGNSDVNRKLNDKWLRKRDKR